MTEDVYALAAGLVKPSEAEETLLRLLCQGAEQSLVRQVKGGREECPEAFLCATAFLAAAGLLDSRGGVAGSVEKFSVGDVSVTTGSTGGANGGGSADRLRKQAERLMAPYCAGDGFAFLGVRG